MNEKSPSISGQENVSTLLASREKPEELKRRLEAHRDALISGVQKGNQALANAYSTLTTPEARGYLSKAASKISGVLMDLATKGKSIIDKHKKNENISTSEYVSVESLAQKTKWELVAMQSEIVQYEKLQKSQEDLAALEKVASAFDNDMSEKSFDELITHYTKMSSDVGTLTLGLPSSFSHKESNQIRLELIKKINDYAKGFNENIEKFRVAKVTYESNVKSLDSFKDNVTKYQAALDVYEKDPSEMNKQVLDGIRQKIDVEKLDKDIFGGDMRINEGQRISNIYQKLWKDSFVPEKEKLEEVEKRCEVIEKNLEITAAVDKQIKVAETELSVVVSYEMSLRSDPSSIDKKVYLDAVELAMGDFATIKKTLVNSPDFPQEYRTEKIAYVNESLKKLIVSKSTDLQRKLIAQKYAQYVSIVTSGDPAIGNVKARAVFTDAFRQLSENDQLVIKTELRGIEIAVSESVEAATCPKIMENFWLAQALYEKGDVEGSKNAFDQFIENDVKSWDFQGNEQLKSKEAAYLNRANAILKNINEVNSDHGDFLKAKDLAQQGDIIGAKKLLKQYLAKQVGKKVEEDKEDYTKIARELLKKIALMQCAQVRAKFNNVKRPTPRVTVGSGQHVRSQSNPLYESYMKYQQLIANVEKSIRDGKYNDFTDAYNDLAAKINVNPRDEFNFLADEIEAENGRSGLLALARKYRESGQYDLAEQTFMQYFGPLLQNIKRSHLTYEKFLGQNDSNSNFHSKISDKIAEAKKVYDARAGMAGPLWAKENPWNEEKVRDGFQIALYQEMLPRELQKVGQSLYQTNQPFASMEENEAWSEFANMRGIHEQGTWKEPFAMSDEELDSFLKNLPVEIAIMAVSGGLGAAAGRMAGQAILRVGLRESGKLAVEAGVRSGTRRALAYGGGLLVENTVFTASNVVMHGVRRGDLDVYDDFKKEWGTGLYTLGALGAVGRVSSALKLGTLSTTGMELAAMGSMHGQITKNDIAIIAGLKIGHGVVGRASKAATNKEKSKTDESAKKRESLEEATTAVGEPPRVSIAPVRKVSTPSYERGTAAAAPRAKRSRSEVLNERRTTNPEVPRRIREAELATSLENLQTRFKENPALKARIDKIIAKRNFNPDILATLDPAEINLLANSDINYLNNRVVEKILRRQYDTFSDTVNGEKVNVRYYTDNCRQLGKGGLGRVREGYFVVWERSGIRSPEPVLRHGAVKEIRSRTADLIDGHPTVQHEISTLREVRDQAGRAYDRGLIQPVFVGQRAIRDARGNIIRYDNVTITEVIGSHTFTDRPDLFSVMQSAPPEFTLNSLSAGLRGVSSLHGSGRMHFDIKPENFFVGTVKGESVSVLGDLAGIPFFEMRDMNISKEMYKGKQYVHASYGRGGFGVPNTPMYFREAYKHLRCQQEWLNAHPEAKSAPESIISLTDHALIGKTVQEIRKYYIDNPSMLPPSVRSVVDHTLREIIIDIKKVPDMDILNKDIKEAQDRHDSAALATAQKAKAEALAGLDNRITTEQIRIRLDSVADMITKERASSGLPVATGSSAPANPNLTTIINP